MDKSSGGKMKVTVSLLQKLGGGTRMINLMQACIRLIIPPCP